MKSIKISLVVMGMMFSSVVKAESGVESLSPELRDLLTKEMVALQEGMQSILPAYVSGNLDEVAKISGKIKNSFILKQQITDKQRQELGTKLPKSFISMDKNFHEYAGMLEHVSEMKNTELVGFYYSKLTESCVACHTEHAQHRFPALDMKTVNDEHLH